MKLAQVARRLAYVLCYLSSDNFLLNVMWAVSVATHFSQHHLEDGFAIEKTS